MDLEDFLATTDLNKICRNYRWPSVVFRVRVYITMLHLHPTNHRIPNEVTMPYWKSTVGSLSHVLLHGPIVQPSVDDLRAPNTSQIKNDSRYASCSSLFSSFVDSKTTVRSFVCHACSFRLHAIHRHKQYTPSYQRMSNGWDITAHLTFPSTKPTRFQVLASKVNATKWQQLNIWIEAKQCVHQYWTFNNQDYTIKYNLATTMKLPPKQPRWQHSLR